MVVLQKLLVIATLALISISFIYFEINFKPGESGYGTATTTSLRAITSTSSIRTTDTRVVEDTAHLYTLEQRKAGDNLVLNPSFEDIIVLDRSSKYYKSQTRMGGYLFPGALRFTEGRRSAYPIAPSPIAGDPPSRS
jgi:hypothetical protein